MKKPIKILREGLVKNPNPKGRPFEAYFADGKNHGQIIVYYKDTNKKNIVGNFNMNKRDKLWQFFNKDEILRKEIIYFI